MILRTQKVLSNKAQAIDIAKNPGNSQFYYCDKFLVYVNIDELKYFFN